MASSRHGIFKVVKSGKDAARAMKEKQDAWHQGGLPWKPGDVAAVNQVAHLQQPKGAVQILNSSDSKQGGLNNSDKWYLRFDSSQQYISRLMGWTGTTSTIQQLPAYALSNFSTKEDAIAFCLKNGWRYEVHESAPSEGMDIVKARPARFKTYGDNFSVKRGGLPVGGLPSEQSMPGKPLGKELRRGKGRRGGGNRNSDC